jgi:predicted RNA-binding protein with EMAP domain
MPTVTVNAHAVTNAGTFAVQVDGNALTALQLIDDPVATLGTTTYTETTTKGMIVGAVRRDADTTLVDTTNEIGPLQMNAAGQLKVEAFSGETLPVSLATVPSHAVTNAGTFAVQVDGAALTALQLIDDPVAVLGTATYTEATTSGMIVGAVRRDADTTLVNTTNEIGPLQMDANGRLKVEVFDGGDSHTVDNAGTFAVQVDGNALTALQLIDNTIFVDDAQFTAGTSSVSAIGLIADEASTDSVDENDVGIPRMTLDRKQITTAYAHAAAGGATPFYNLDCDETEDAIKASAGKLYALGAINRSTGVRYLKLYNATTANVTVGTTTPVLVIPLPTMADTNGAGVVLPIPSCGIQFDTAITIAATTGLADNDTGAPGANDVIAFGAYL